MAIENHTNERELVENCVKGVKSAQEAFYLQFSGVLFAICLRYSADNEMAQDMFQDSMIKIFQKLRDFRFEGSLEGWLKRVCVNHCLDSLKRSKAKFNESIDDAHSNIESEFKTDSQIQMNQLMALLQKLPVGYRTVFNLYAIEGYTHNEIGVLLGISESTSKTQLFKARKWLQQYLKHG
jgi:RNA polymerase sigma-70 factor (ECF subfamily)